MWKFRSTERLDTLEKALEQLADKLEDLRTLPKKLSLEWEDTLDKLARQASRINQRARRDLQGSSENEEAPPDNPKEAPAVAGDHQMLGAMRQRVFGGQR